MIPTLIFLNFLLKVFLTVTNFRPSFRLILTGLAVVSVIAIIYLVYNLLKRFLNSREHSKYLLVVRGEKFSSSINFNLAGSKPQIRNSTNFISQIIDRELLKDIKVQLFENSYFNYFTGYLMKPIGQFLIQLERESFCLKTIQDQTRIQDQDSWHFFGEEVKASKALEALILETSFGDFLFNDRLKVKIYEAVESEFKIVNPNFEKILKEETVEIAIFLKIKVDLDQLQSYHFSDFDIAVESLERKNLMFELKAREAKEFYPYNWVYRRVLPPSKVGYDPEASLKYNHEAAKNLSEVQLKRTQHKSKISFRTDTASEN